MADPFGVGAPDAGAPAPGAPAARLLIVLAALALGACAPEGLAPGPQAGPEAARAALTPGAPDQLAVGHRLMDGGEPALALKSYLRAAARHGPTAEILAALGTANLALGRLGQSEQLLRRAIEADERFVPAWNNLGVVLMETGRPGEARRVFRTAYALDHGASRRIRENLLTAIERTEHAPPAATDGESSRLLRSGPGRYLLYE